MDEQPPDLTRQHGALAIRPPVDDDADGLAAAVQASLAELQVYMQWATDDYGPDDALQWIRGEIDPLAYPFLAVEDGEPVGSIGLQNIDWANRSGELGYWIRSDRTGAGRAVRTARMVCDIGFEELGLHRIELLILGSNTRSMRVAEKLGATHEGTRRGRVMFQGTPTDCEAWSLLANDPRS